MLKKENRLNTTYEFNKVKRFGEKYRGGFFSIAYLNVRDYGGPTRFGIVVANKFNKLATKRNRVKRVFREVIRLNLDKIKDGYWVVIFPSKLSEDKGYEEVNTEFSKVLPTLSISK